MKSIWISILLMCHGNAFVPLHRSSMARRYASLDAMKPDGNDGIDTPPPFVVDRRGAIKAAALSVSALGFSSIFPSLSYADDIPAPGIGTDPAHPIVIIGAGGKLGKLCLEILNQRGLYTKGLTRSGRDVLGVPSKYATYGPGDVTKYDQLKSSVAGASAVIFAASASGKKNGGDPAHVDYFGLYNTAKACLDCEVPKLAVVSAGTVTRPESVGFKATNLFVKYAYGEKIMDYKIAGEAITRDLYRASPNKNLAYTVIRPGGLNDKPSIGSDKVHVSQGDVFSSEVTREDVALVTVAALLGGKKSDFVTFEVNQVEGIGKAQGNLPEPDPRLVHAGAKSFDALLDGLLTDEAIQNYYPNLISDFRGSNVEPVEKFI